MRITVVTPFLDKRHGTERALSEQVERLARQYQHEVHIYAQRVTDIQTELPDALRDDQNGALYWHKVPQVPGPHLVRFLWWLISNSCVRKWDAKRGHVANDITFSAGINCLDADVIVVHALFHRLRHLSGITTVRSFRQLHRRLFYRLLSALERRIYSKSEVSLAAVSPRIGILLAQIFGRTEVRIIPNAVDGAQFSPRACAFRRQESRALRDFREDDLVLLLIGNDWKIKGAPAVLSAIAACPTLHLRLLAVGEDDPQPYTELARGLGIADRCRWESPTQDIVSAYAAADVYVSPSREDSFGLPVLEAMACGLPSISSALAGVSALIHDEIDGFVLSDPTDTGRLAQILERLGDDRAYRQRVGDAATETAQQWTWDRSAALLDEFLREAAKKKHPRPGV